MRAHLEINALLKITMFIPTYILKIHKKLRAIFGSNQAKRVLKNVSRYICSKPLTIVETAVIHVSRLSVLLKVD